MKKLLVIFGAVAFALVGASMFAAFEAHVVNVTATIENALAVSTNAIDFGTVFPQEHLDQPLEVRLSGSFMTEDRVDDVKYFIRQKPKCGITEQNGTVLVGETVTGHINVDGNGGYTIDCGETPVLEAGQAFGVLPSLCEYISKEADTDVANDETQPSFHTPWTVENGQIVWNDTDGYLSKQDKDTVDNWTIDLAVPCFGGHCAQDWESFVERINPGANAAEYVQPLENEHKVFGCDLWVEVSGVSEAGARESGEPETLFSDDFNDANYDGWLLAHFDGPSTGTPESDVLATSTNAYEGVSLRIEDNVGVYRNLSTLGYDDIELSYCRRTSSSSGSDRLRVGWKVGAVSSNWGDYIQLEEFVPDTAWACANFSLPVSADNGDISLVFFFDNGEGDYGLFDAVDVKGISIY